VSDAAGLLVSVRGEARRMVPPDYALVAATIASSQGSKAEAVRALLRAWTALLPISRRGAGWRLMPAPDGGR
jgi:hypothetical protein